MTVERDPLIDAIRQAGAVPPPPAREAAFARAMATTDVVRAKRRFRRGFIALFAAAMLAAPAGVFAAHTFHGPTAAIPQIQKEAPDPGSSIAHETRDVNDVELRDTPKTEDGSGAEAENEVSDSPEGSSDDAATIDDGASASSGDSDTETLEGGEESTPSPTSSVGEGSDEGPVSAQTGSD